MTSTGSRWTIFLKNVVVQVAIKQKRNALPLYLNDRHDTRGKKKRFKNVFFFLTEKIGEFTLKKL